MRILMLEVSLKSLSLMLPNFSLIILCLHNWYFNLILSGFDAEHFHPQTLCLLFFRFCLFSKKEIILCSFDTNDKSLPEWCFIHDFLLLLSYFETLSSVWNSAPFSWSANFVLLWTAVDIGLILHCVNILLNFSCWTVACTSSPVAHWDCAATIV